jgi:predicted TIM-barrel fold metal-dependent hydrolase
MQKRRCLVEHEMVIDGHQHFRDPAQADYPWMDAAELAPIRRAFGPSDLAPLLRANGIDASILVQCRSSNLTLVATYLGSDGITQSD